jgi:hypothetical protein
MDGAAGHAHPVLAATVNPGDDDDEDEDGNIEPDDDEGIGEDDEDDDDEEPLWAAAGSQADNRRTCDVALHQAGSVIRPGSVAAA